jgi:hypothetical protein
MEAWSRRVSCAGRLIFSGSVGRKVAGPASRLPCANLYDGNGYEDEAECGEELFSLERSSKHGDFHFLVFLARSGARAGFAFWTSRAGESKTKTRLERS